jgi:hypothetical protein
MMASGPRHGDWTNAISPGTIQGIQLIVEPDPGAARPANIAARRQIFATKSSPPNELLHLLHEVRSTGTAKPSSNRRLLHVATKDDYRWLVAMLHSISVLDNGFPFGKNRQLKQV